MKASAFTRVLQFVFVTWVLYIAILFFIDFAIPPVKAGFGEGILALMAGILMLAPFIVVWDFFVLRRYYPSKVTELTRGEASRSPQQSA